MHGRVVCAVGRGGGGKFAEYRRWCGCVDAHVVHGARCGEQESVWCLGALPASAPATARVELDEVEDMAEMCACSDRGGRGEGGCLA